MARGRLETPSRLGLGLGLGLAARGKRRLGAGTDRPRNGVFALVAVSAAR